MKKIISLSFLFVSLAFIFSCKKSDSTPSYHISCSVNGTTKTFNVDATVTIDSNASMITGIEIDGATSADANTAGIDIGVYGNQIIAGAYADTSGKVEMSSQYYPSASSSTSYDCGSDEQTNANINSIKIANGLKVVFSSITDKAVQGTFSGDYYPDGDVTGTPLQIRNGSFYVKVQ